MFPGKTAINKICKINYRALQVVYNFPDSYDAILSINNISIHQKRLQYLVVEVYKTAV